MTAMFDLTGKTALITGSSRGLGFAYAEALAAAGAEVILNGTRESVLNEAVEQLKNKGYRVSGPGV
ncbi:NAD(P)-dependent dehydrogenase (short-subunit alcohol dehydrogenase family) [Pantoea ananatis]|nr:NAD(P)-dependent dehydrogenase (short-subunit alcohol dehydrogenase family) [Pantoea ananatis]